MVEVLYLSSAAYITFRANRSALPVSRAAKDEGTIEIAVAPQYQ